MSPSLPSCECASHPYPPPSQPDFLSSLERQPGVRKPTLEGVKANLVDRPITFEECVVWARLKFEEDFHNSIAQLIFNFPLDMNTPSGTPFWSGPKRPPSPLQAHSAALPSLSPPIKHPPSPPAVPPFRRLCTPSPSLFLSPCLFPLPTTHSVPSSFSSLIPLLTLFFSLCLHCSLFHPVLLRR